MFIKYKVGNLCVTIGQHLAEDQGNDLKTAAGLGGCAVFN